MTNHTLDDGTVVSSSRATGDWTEATYWDGSNHISRATGSQWLHQTLFLSKSRRFWIEHTSDYSGTLPTAELLSREDAARWLITNGHDLPPLLQSVADGLLD